MIDSSDSRTSLTVVDWDLCCLRCPPRAPEPPGRPPLAAVPPDTGGAISRPESEAGESADTSRLASPPDLRNRFLKRVNIFLPSRATILSTQLAWHRLTNLPLNHPARVLRLVPLDPRNGHRPILEPFPGQKACHQSVACESRKKPAIIWNARCVPQCCCASRRVFSVPNVDWMSTRLRRIHQACTEATDCPPRNACQHRIICPTLTLGMRFALRREAAGRPNR